MSLIRIVDILLAQRTAEAKVERHSLGLVVLGNVVPFFAHQATLDGVDFEYRAIVFIVLHLDLSRTLGNDGVPVGSHSAAFIGDS